MSEMHAGILKEKTKAMKKTPKEKVKSKSKPKLGGKIMVQAQMWAISKPGRSVQHGCGLDHYGYPALGMDHIALFKRKRYAEQAAGRWKGLQVRKVILIEVA